MTYSNVTKDEMTELLKLRLNGITEIPEKIKVKPLEPQKCVHAEDTGETAFLRMPCRGNKIICHKIEGHISYTKACTSKSCKFYESDLT